MKQKFRNKLMSGEVLAIDANALEKEYDTLSNLKESTDQPKSAIAIIDINGPLEHKLNCLFDSYDDIEERIKCSIQDNDVKAIILKIDSPGGEAAGSVECHKTIKNLSKQYNKPIYAYVDELAASAAYAIASACEEIWLPETGTVGSIGVIATLVDVTKSNEKEGINVKLITTGTHKADGNPNVEISQDVIDTMQERVNYLGNVFFTTVAESREMDIQEVIDLQAGVFQGNDAVEKKLANGVESFNNFYALINISISNNNNNNVSPAVSNNSARIKIKGLGMKNKLSTIKLIEGLNASLITATTEVEKKAILAQLELANKTLAKFEVKVKVEDAEEKEDAEAVDEEDEEEKAEDKEEEKSESEEPEDDDNEDDEDEKSVTDTEDEEDAKDKALFNAKSGLYTSARLLRYTKQLTGQKSLSAVFGAIAAMIDNKKDEGKAAAKLAKLESESMLNKVESMLNKAKKEGRIAPSQIKSLTAQGIKDIKWLKGYLASAPKLVRTMEDGDQSISIKESTSVLSTLSVDQMKIIKASAAQSGKDIETVAKDLLATIAAKNNSNKF